MASVAHPLVFPWDCVCKQPISARVHVAGEATCLSAAATIHGAMMSAQRAVRELLASVPARAMTPVAGGVPARL